jgi:hypothetical protein
MDWRRVAMLAALALLWLVWTTEIVMAFQRWMNTRADVLAYWFAGKHLREGAGLYVSVQESPLGLPFLYPPALAALFALLTSMVPAYGMAAWAALHLLALYALTRLIASRLACAGYDAIAVQLLVLVFLSGPLAGDVEEGQVNLLVMLLLGAGLFQLLDRHERTAGALLAGALHLKVLPVVAAVALVFGRRVRAASSMLIAALLLILLPSLAAAPALGFAALPYAVEQNWLWLADRFIPVLVSGDLPGSGAIATPGLSLEAVLSRWFTDLGEAPARLFLLPGGIVQALHRLLTATLVAVALFGTWRDRARARRLAAWTMLLFVAVQLGNELCWPHHLMSLLLVVVFGFLALDGGRRHILLLSGLPFLFVFSLPALVLVVGSLFDWKPPLQVYQHLLQWGAPTLASLALWGTAASLLLRERETGEGDEPYEGRARHSTGSKVQEGGASLGSGSGIALAGPAPAKPDGRPGARRASFPLPALR